MKKCGIYYIENIINNKKYIGQSTNIEQRIRQHRSSLRHNKHRNIELQNEWNQYSEDCFIFNIIEECEESSLDDRERYWISYYNTMNFLYGYNKETGGKKNKKSSEDTKKQISAHHIDVSGQNNPFWGKTHSKEIIDKIISNPKYINRKHIGEESHFAKLTLEEATYIKKFLKEHKTNRKEDLELAKRFNVGINAIEKIKYNRTWKQIVV